MTILKSNTTSSCWITPFTPRSKLTRVLTRTSITILLIFGDLTNSTTVCRRYNNISMTCLKVETTSLLSIDETTWIRSPRSPVTQNTVNWTRNCITRHRFREANQITVGVYKDSAGAFLEWNRSTRSLTCGRAGTPSTPVADQARRDARRHNARLEFNEVRTFSTMIIRVDCDRPLFSNNTNTTGYTARTRDERTHLAIYRAREKRASLVLGLFRATANIRITRQELLTAVTLDGRICDTT